MDKINYILLIIIVILFNTESISQSSQKIKMDNDLILLVEMNRDIQFLGSNENIRISLTSRKRNKKIPNLNSGKIDFILSQRVVDGGSRELRRSIGGKYHNYTSSNQGITEFGYHEVELTDEIINPGDTLVKEVNLFELFGRNLAVASYELTVIFEDKTMGSIQFGILADYQIGMNVIIGALMNHELIDGLSPLNAFMYFTGKPDWFNEYRFSETLPDDKTAELINWWNENGPLFLSIEDYYQNQNDNIQDLHSYVSELLDLMEFGDEVQKANATNELITILGMTELKISVDNIDELKSYWDKHKEDIVYQTQVLNENAQISRK